jgi:transcriptional regulator with XRE-family HTH domain
LGRNIKNLRIKKKLTQEQVGEFAGINPKYLGEIERGEKNPTAVVIYKLSKALGVLVPEILSDKKHPYINEDLLKEVERLFLGKGKKDIQKAIRILEVFFE